MGAKGESEREHAKRKKEKRGKLKKEKSILAPSMSSYIKGNEREENCPPPPPTFRLDLASCIEHEE